MIPSPVPKFLGISILIALVIPCHNIADAKGWWDDCKNPDGTINTHRVWDGIPMKLALIASEASEALEDLRIGRFKTERSETGKPIGYCSELADVVIRIFDLAGAAGLTLLEGAGSTPILSPKEHADIQMIPGFGLAYIHLQVGCCLSAWQAADVAGLTAALNRIISACDLLCGQQDGNLTAEILTKMGYNLGRSYRHGGKLA